MFAFKNSEDDNRSWLVVQKGYFISIYFGLNQKLKANCLIPTSITTMFVANFNYHYFKYNVLC